MDDLEVTRTGSTPAAGWAGSSDHDPHGFGWSESRSQPIPRGCRQARQGTGHPDPHPPGSPRIAPRHSADVFMNPPGQREEESWRQQ
jgi:hypothetical protein